MQRRLFGERAPTTAPPGGRARYQINLRNMIAVHHIQRNELSNGTWARRRRPLADIFGPLISLRLRCRRFPSAALNCCSTRLCPRCRMSSFVLQNRNLVLAFNSGPDDVSDFDPSHALNSNSGRTLNFDLNFNFGPSLDSRFFSPFRFLFRYRYRLRLRFLRSPRTRVLISTPRRPQNALEKCLRSRGPRGGATRAPHYTPARIKLRYVRAENVLRRFIAPTAVVPLFFITPGQAEYFAPLDRPFSLVCYCVAVFLRAGYLVSDSARVRACGVPRSVHRAAAVKLRASVPVIYSGDLTVCTPSPLTVSAPRKRFRRFTLQIPIAILVISRVLLHA
ncbi:hypothetical protein EVAR_59946_1 [Eumeta japonica]|uniref:Uncharacterized protein n=1 Tax=Eumeta variegata TaxID=151549 RepID=A0A4C1ZF06_EUMVA|nr:hypothetical protein EVAR_59946_1 [Eumeta japonica]